MSGSYHGGGTVITPWKRVSREDGWEPDRIRSKSMRAKGVKAGTGQLSGSEAPGETGAERTRHCEALGRAATDFEIAVVEFVRLLAKADAEKAPRPQPPAEILAKYGPERLGKYIKLLRKSALYKKAARALG